MSDQVALEDILQELGAEILEDERLVQMFEKHNAQFFGRALITPTFAHAKLGGKLAAYVLCRTGSLSFIRKRYARI